MNKHWVNDLCEKIYKSDLYKKIKWVANSRVNPLEQQTLVNMKKVGCWLVAFGFESGHPETLIGIKKGATVDHNIQARQMTKKAGLKCYGFFLIGLPWENWPHLNATKDHIFKLSCEFIELHIAIPYHGTGLYDQAKESGTIDEIPLGRDYFNSPSKGTKYLSIEEIMKFRKRTLIEYHIRPSYMLERFSESLTNYKTFKNYTNHALRLLKNNLALQ